MFLLSSIQFEFLIRNSLSAELGIANILYIDRSIFAVREFQYNDTFRDL